MLIFSCSAVLFWYVRSYAFRRWALTLKENLNKKQASVFIRTPCA
jgi:hypothetical protein